MRRLLLVVAGAALALVPAASAGIPNPCTLLAFSVEQAGGFLFVWQHGYAVSVVVSLGTNPIPVEKAVAKLIVRRL